MGQKSKDPEIMARRRKNMERLASAGLILVCAGLVAPFAGTDNAVVLSIFKWVFAAGALIFTAARSVNVNDPSDPVRVRRFRRMEMWAGISFCIAAFFWFYNSHTMPGVMLSLRSLQETILFTLTGALIQIVASVMIMRLQAKAQKKDGGAD